MILGVRFLEWVKRISLLRSPKWFIAIAIALYWISGVILIAQKPGLQDDEALLVAGAVHMAHSGTTFEISQTPNAWVCPLGRCIPLMSALYVGAVKEYAVLPLFAWFGPRMSFIRIVSLILGTLGLWGIYRVVAEFFGVRLAALTAFAIAVNPAFVNMTVFDNNAVGVAMAGLGLSWRRPCALPPTQRFLGRLCSRPRDGIRYMGPSQFRLGIDRGICRRPDCLPAPTCHSCGPLARCTSRGSCWRLSFSAVSDHIRRSHVESARGFVRRHADGDAAARPNLLVRRYVDFRWRTSANVVGASITSMAIVVLPAAGYCSVFRLSVLHSGGSAAAAIVRSGRSHNILYRWNILVVLQAPHSRTSPHHIVSSCRCNCSCG